MKGQIPVLYVEGEIIPEMWENSVLALWEKGIDIKTQYDRAGDPPSKDCTMVMVCQKPFQEPRIHRCFPGSLGKLEEYRQEVILGIHDSWVDVSDVSKWDYSYHGRLFAYDNEGAGINQINQMIEKLVDEGFTRRAQAVTWRHQLDQGVSDPPCLQRIWARIIPDGDGNLYLNMNLHWRSRDAYKAAFMNVYVMTLLQEMMAEEVTKRIKKKVLVGRYVDISDSYHIYGKDFYGSQGFVDFFLKQVKERTFSKRTWTTDFAEPFFIEAREQIKEGKTVF